MADVLLHRGSEFLRRLYPEGPWTVTAIEVDAPGIITETFTAIDALDAWVKQNDGKRNLYYSVNPVIGNLTKKASRECISEVAYLHVDIDPRAGEDLASERKRILALLQNPPPGVPRPTVIVFSGGGYQALWKLETPIPVNGDLALAEDAKLYNLQLEQLLGGDSCHDISRILRIPSWNIPNAKKLKKGRSKIEGDVAEFNDLVYGLDSFDKAVPMQIPERLTPGLVSISGNIERQNLEALDVSPDIKDVILDGTSKKYPSRSEALFAVCCALFRARCTDDQVYSVITDSEYKISESVLEKGTATERYALRQIERAKVAVTDPNLARMNEKFAVIRNMGGQCVVLCEYKKEDHITTSIMRVRALKDAYANDRIQVGETDGGTPKLKSIADWWFAHPQRRTYERIVFEPGKETPLDYNMWTGFGVDLRYVPGKSDSFLKHVLENVCGGNTEHYEYLMNWMARAVQKPAELGEVAVVMRGEEGVGKSFFAGTFGKLFGRHYMKVSQPGHLIGNFNGHLQSTVILFADEGFYAGDRRHASVLKDLITGDTLTIERKGVDVEEYPNHLHILMASNNDWVVPAGAQARRYFVLDVGKAHIQDSAYFGRIASDLEEGGLSDLLYALMNRDISDFQVRDVPFTEALAEQQEFSRSTEEGWWFEKLADGKLRTNDKTWTETITVEELYADYFEDARKYRYDSVRKKRGLFLALKKMCPGVVPVLMGSANNRQRGYKFPPIEECRKAWNESHRKQIDWDNLPTVEVVEQREAF